jgi:DNA-binding transcriptional ArsR family regulator
MVLLSEPVLNDVSRLFRALGDTSRLRILRVLLEAGHALSQKALAEAAGLTQANASKHLIQLVDAGLVTRESQGNLVLFTPVTPLVTDLCATVCTQVADRIKGIYESLS